MGTAKDTGTWSFRPETSGLSQTTKPATTRTSVGYRQTQRGPARSYHRAQQRPKEPGLTFLTPVQRFVHLTAFPNESLTQVLWDSAMSPSKWEQEELGA